MTEKIELTAHNFLKACYLNQELPVSTRMKAAQIAIGYEKPRLAATLEIKTDVGTLLDNARARKAMIDRARDEGIDIKELIRGPKLIEGEVIERGEPIAEPAPLKRRF